MKGSKRVSQSECGSTGSTLFGLMVVVWVLLLAGCDATPPRLAQILERGELIVVTRPSATTYFENADGHGGFDYDLLQGFARQLGVKLTIIEASSLAELFMTLRDDRADLAAAALVITDAQRQWLDFSTPYAQVKNQLIYHQDRKQPRTMEQLLQQGGSLEVVADSRSEQILQTLLHDYHELSWRATPSRDEALLERVALQQIDFTVTDSNTFALNRRYYPELAVAFDLTPSESLAWAVPKSQDPTLHEAMSRYLNRLIQSGELARLRDRYFSQINVVSYQLIRNFIDHLQSRLPLFRPIFEYAAREVRLDWRILAAMAYQESRWEADAVSPEGVKGLMMLTQATAKSLGVENRADPVQSIRGGANYLRKMVEALPPRITDPDRTWFGMAAYNVGIAHLEDGRILTQRAGENPDLWRTVRNYLPLLKDPKWHATVKYGQARGDIAVHYVDAIRGYYDALVWYTDREAAKARLHRAVIPAAIPAPSHLLTHPAL